METRLAKVLDMLSIYPNDSFLNYAAGLEYVKAENYEEALKYLEFVRENDPEHLATYYQLGKLHEARGQYKQAIRIYDEGIRVAQKQGAAKTLEELQGAKEEVVEDE